MPWHVNVAPRPSLTPRQVVVGYQFKDGNVKVRCDPNKQPELSGAVPIYLEIPGWQQDLSSYRCWNDLPAECKHFVKL